MHTHYMYFTSLRKVGNSVCWLTSFEVKHSHLPREGFGQRVWRLQLSITDVEELVFNKQLLDVRVPCQGAIRFQGQTHNRNG